jgi:hypothetical protein
VRQHGAPSTIVDVFDLALEALFEDLLDASMEELAADLVGG